MCEFFNELIVEPACIVHPEVPLRKVLSLLEDKESTYSLVADDNYYLGIYIVTPNILMNKSLDNPIKNEMITDIPTITSIKNINDDKLDNFKLPIIPVVENQKLKGIVKKHDYYLYQIKKCLKEVKNLNNRLQNLHQSDKQLEEVMNHSFDGFAITNRDGITIMVNNGWDRLTGLERKDVVGVPLNKLVTKGFFSDSVTMKVLKNKKPTTIMQQMKSGKQAMMTGSPVFDSKGEVEQVIINIRDMTELTWLKESLEEKEKLAERYQTEIAQIRLKQSSEENIIAKSKSMQNLLDIAFRIASVETTVLITGESGTGKGVLARYIHDCRENEDRPFITVNCGSIPYELLESELFGYVEGAFTGATRKGKPGMFELADGGTLFLDEIAELPMELQVKLLNVIQEKELTRLGDTKPIKLDVRIIAATNQNLTKLVAEKQFREDLYYRLNVIPLSVPPLRSRKEDILPLVVHYLNIYNKKVSQSKKLSSNLVDVITNYEWPGNIRELANVVERMVVTSKDDTLTSDNFPFNHKGYGSQSTLMEPTDSHHTIPTLQEARDSVEFKLIKRALQEEKTQAKAANKLGISLSTLIRKMKQLNVS